MGRKCIISAVVMFIMAWGLSFVVHGLLLSGDYSVTQGMRPPAEAQKLIPFLILAQALFGIAFAWIYVQGKEDKPWLAQGLRFGIAVAFQIVFDTIRIMLMGIVLAWINR